MLIKLKNNLFRYEDQAGYWKEVGGDRPVTAAPTPAPPTSLQ